MLRTAIGKLKVIPSKVRDLRDEQRHGTLHRQLKDFTMIPPKVFSANLILARTISNLHGCIVECGVWRGGMSAGLASVLGADRKYYLLDSFEGLPPPKPIDGQAAASWAKNTTGPEYYDNGRVEPDFARTAMAKVGAKQIELIKGFFKDSLPSFEPEPIALLRLDADWYESTMDCLTHLFDRVVPNGIIILDDYFAWDGCSRALHDFLSSRKAVERIQSFRGVCFLRKI